MMAVADADTVGFCAEEVNPFGPVQEYVAPVTVPTFNVREPPTHTGPLLPGVKAVTSSSTVMMTTLELTVPQLPEVTFLR